MDKEQIKVEIQRSYSSEDYRKLMNAARKAYGKHTKDQLVRTLINYEKSNMDAKLRYEAMIKWKKDTLARKIYEITPHAKVAKYRPVNKGAVINTQKPDDLKSDDQKWSISSFIVILIFVILVIYLVI